MPNNSEHVLQEKIYGPQRRVGREKTREHNFSTLFTFNQISRDVSTNAFYRFIQLIFVVNKTKL